MAYYLIKIFMKMRSIDNLPYTVKGIHHHYYYDYYYYYYYYHYETASFMKLYLYPLVYIISWVPSLFTYPTSNW